MIPRFRIGQKFKRQRKHAKIETIVDIFTTTSKQTGEIVKIRYVASHDFLGQQVLDYSVLDTTIARSDFIK